MFLSRKFLDLISWIRKVILFVLLYSILVYVFVSNFNKPAISEHDRANMAMQSMESKQKSDELIELLDKFMSASNDKHEPSIEYEKLRRRVYENTQELWNYISSELNKIKKKVSTDQPELIDKITNVMELGAEQKRSLISDMGRMRMIDGYEQWRHDEAKSLSNLVQRRLHQLQNPKDCKNAKKLVCRLNMNCGYGCELHHIIYCLMVAYATERTFILHTKAWKYHKVGWENVFQPVSETCQIIEPTAREKKWPHQYDAQVVTLQSADRLTLRPPYLPLTIPADLAPRLERLHGDPTVWWVGQFLKYILRPREATHAMIERTLENLGFKKPIIGVHIRRTDKVGAEAGYHNIEEYMSYVEDYFLQLQMNGTNIKRRVFLASDEVSVIDEARKKYPSYEIIGDSDIARMAAVSTRYTDSSLSGIISDIHILSLCDYLVCTFSSNICRVAYEIMQTMYPDASNRFKSLDDIYFYSGQNAHNSEVVISHQPRHHDEIYMEAGDKVIVVGNHWDGYSKGRNNRTNQMGLFPSFKVNDIVDAVELPIYAEKK